MPSIRWGRFPGRSKPKSCGTVDHGKDEGELKGRVRKRYAFGKKCIHVLDIKAEIEGDPRSVSTSLEETHNEHVSKDLAENYHHKVCADTRTIGNHKCEQPITAEITILDTKCMEDVIQYGEKQTKASLYDEVTDVDCSDHGYCEALESKATLHSKSIKAMRDTGHTEEESLSHPHESNVDACDLDDNSEYQHSIPCGFLCGISKKLMEDPMVTASGHTFESACIQAWLDEGNTCCPITHKALPHLQLIPNLTLKALISSWSSSRPSQLGTSVHHSFSSCMSSFSTCPSLMTSHQRSFVSCMSVSLSKFSRDSELYSLSSSSTSSLPELVREDELHSYSSSSVSIYSLARLIHGFSSTPSSSDSSACWEQEKDVPSLQKQAVSAACLNESHNKAVQERLNEGNSMRKGLQHEISGSTSAQFCGCVINSLVSNLGSEHGDVQRTAAAELRMLAKNDNANRLMIVNAGALSPLVALSHASDEALQLEAITTLLNLSLNHAIKDKIIQEGGIEALVKVLEVGLSWAVKENAAAALAHLAVGEEKKAMIGSAGAIPLLVDLLGRGPTLRGKKDAAAALYRLSSVDVNKEMMVRAGVTKFLVDLMCGKGDMVDKALVIVGNLVSIEEGRAPFVEEGGIRVLMQLVQAGVRRTPRLAVRILFQLCTHSSKHQSLVLQRDPLPTLMALSERGNLRLKNQVAELVHILIMDT